MLNDVYYNLVTNIGNFFDGIMIVDENCIVRYNRLFVDNDINLNEKNSIGKTPMDIWPNLTAETSTCSRAVKYGETSTNQTQILRHASGREISAVDNTFPIVENGQIIGAISTTKFIDALTFRNRIDLSNLTVTHTDDLYMTQDIIGASEEIKLLKYKIHKVSQTNTSILIYGETGTGKELVAQSIHSSSTRKNNLFISQNCAAIPNTLLESIFFGTTKGSYTGAESKAGIFELANGGTVFLDEINSMDLNMQAKLLKAIEEKKITRIGGSAPKKIDVRIIAAINEHPQCCINENRIRKDLFYRLSGVQLEVPPLRERKGDIPYLTTHFIKVYNKEMKKNIKGVSPEVSDFLKSYDWPGNVRELKNSIEGAFNFASSSIIEKDDFSRLYWLDDQTPSTPSYPDQYWFNGSLKEGLETFEKAFIAQRGEQTSSLAKLADELKISRQTLNYKLNKYQLKFGRNKSTKVK
ncbi:sigma-54 interaction domain-containing protein [Aminipila luticellarii]|uniref:AAA family ATPase n=1 Tax=Aminipila luticellarii TaxID=2507160 RepID=A0A410PTY3_9FIRM|nr:sigma 54-interacting transcriptional regulator [Aminipila luticellarii]QAT42338.1 AAA family ATPase [Aminipila luticellarii]